MTDLIPIAREMAARALLSKIGTSGNWEATRKNERLKTRVAAVRSGTFDTAPEVLSALEALHIYYSAAQEAALATSKLYSALVNIRTQAEKGEICDDVAWYDGHITLYDFIEAILDDSPTPVIRDLFPRQKTTQQLQDENTRLRCALRPFALHVRDDAPDDQMLESIAWSVGQHRAARKALEE